MAYVDFLSPLHKSTQRDYLARVNDPEYPKAKAAALAKKFDVEYWDGDRRINYGGYRYLPGRWEKVARMMAERLSVSSSTRSVRISSVEVPRKRRPNSPWSIAVRLITMLSGTMRTAPATAATSASKNELMVQALT